LNKNNTVNNKEFIQELSKRVNTPTAKVQEMVQSLITEVTNELQAVNDKTVAIQGFGTFEVKKRLERISVNPVTQQRMLVPPKLTLTFHPSPKMKELFK
jgi:DNA-binding protein HU-beta